MKRLLQLRSNILVPSDDQMIHTGENIIAGAAVGENGELKLSRKERKMIINFLTNLITTITVLLLREDAMIIS